MCVIAEKYPLNLIRIMPAKGGLTFYSFLLLQYVSNYLMTADGRINVCI